jgi:hypothetical protein
LPATGPITSVDALTTYYQAEKLKQQTDQGALV